MTDFSPLEIERLQKLKRELPYFARNALRIRTKDGAVVPFALNRAQLHLHNRLEAQRAKTGRVRAILVKGRQMGASTYLQGRFYHRLWGSGKALSAFILTHEQPATDNLFAMARRFQELNPLGELVPPTVKANAKELRFADNDCGYQVATAGTREVGRSTTIQLFHGSEVAFWPNAEDHATAILNTAISDAPGTEAILESTANGVGNFFHRMAMKAVRGQSEFEAIFIPWFWGDDYQRECPQSFEPSEQWMEYAKVHKLTWEQLYWAFLKNREMAASISASADEPCWKFMQEFPATFDEAFQSSGNAFIPATSVLRARKPEAPIIGRGPIILGVDPARTIDKVGIIDRCGRRMGERICERMEPGGNLVHLAGRIAKIIDRIRPDAVAIDVGGNGAGVFDALLEMGYDNLHAVNFGSSPLGTSPTGDDLYFNRRAEMYDTMRMWFETEGGVQIPDDDGLQGDLTAMSGAGSSEPGSTRYNTSNELVLEEKANIKKRLGASPDLADACALTFAVPFAQTREAGRQPPVRRNKNRRSGY